MNVNEFINARRFAPDDEIRLNELLAPAVGQRCFRVEESYGETIVLQIARDVTANSFANADTEPDAIFSWLCAIVVVHRDLTLDDRNGDFPRIIDVLGRLVGERIERISVSPQELSLIVQFAGDTCLFLIPDTGGRDGDPDDSDLEWFVRFRGHYSVGVDTGRRWSITRG